MKTLTLKDYKEIRTPFVFFDETGSLNDKINRFFCLGMVKCMQPFYLDSKIREIRQKHQFYDEIKWNTLSKAKVNVIKEIVEADFVTTPKDIRFEVDVKHNLNESLSRLAIGGIHRVDSKGVSIIQIVDLFIGAVVYCYKKDLKLVSGDKNKIKILDLILNKLQKKNFVGGINTKKFKVFEYDHALEGIKKGPSS